MVIHLGVQLIGARGDLILRVGELGVQLEQELVLDQAVLLQHIHDGIHGGVLINFDDGGGVLLVQAQQVAGPNPAQRRQDGGDADDQQYIQQGAGQPGPGAALAP